MSKLSIFFRFYVHSYEYFQYIKIEKNLKVTVKPEKNEKNLKRTTINCY